MRGDIIIRPETPDDYEAVTSLILRSFSEGTDYSDGSDVAALVEEIRNSDNYLPELSFVAELHGLIVGHFLFSRFALSSSRDSVHPLTGENDIVMLAPVAVHPDYFHQGIGCTMLRKGISAARMHGLRGIIVEGDFHFYNQLGFRTSEDFNIRATSGIPLTEPRCMMCLELYEGALKDIEGYVVYMYNNA